MWNYNKMETVSWFFKKNLTAIIFSQKFWITYLSFEISMTSLEIFFHGICKNMEKTFRSIYHQKGETIHFLIYVKSVETCIIVKLSNGNQNIMVVHYYGFPKSPSPLPPLTIMFLSIYLNNKKNVINALIFP